MPTGRILVILSALFWAASLLGGCDSARTDTAAMLRAAEQTAERMGTAIESSDDDDVGFDWHAYHARLLALLAMHRDQGIRSPLPLGAFVSRNDDDSVWVLSATWVGASPERPTVFLYDASGNLVGRGDVDDQYDAAHSLIRSQYFTLSTPASPYKATPQSHPVIVLSCEPDEVFGLFSHSAKTGTHFVRVENTSVRAASPD